MNPYITVVLYVFHFPIISQNPGKKKKKKDA